VEDEPEAWAAALGVAIRLVAWVAHCLQALREVERVAVGAILAHAIAARHRVSGRIRPLDCRLIAHPIPAFSTTRALRSSLTLTGDAPHASLDRQSGLTLSSTGSGVHSSALPHLHIEAPDATPHGGGEAHTGTGCVHTGGK
jgi:hypothetical protein